MTPLEIAQKIYDEAYVEVQDAKIVLDSAERHLGVCIAALDKAKQVAAAAIPVDRTAVVLTDGSPVPADDSHKERKPNGQQAGYVVLSEAERAKGFVRPVRVAYRHTKCEGITTMSLPLAETYARDPYFYSGTFCSTCGDHFPVGLNGEFVWVGTTEKVGT